MVLQREAISLLQVGELTKSLQEVLLDLWINLLNSPLLERNSSLSTSLPEEMLDLSSLRTSRLRRPSSGLHHFGWRWVADRIVTILQDLLRAFWRFWLNFTASESRRAGVQYVGLYSFACDSSMQLVKRLQSASFKANARLPRSKEMFPRVNSILRWLLDWWSVFTCHCFTWARAPGDVRVKSIIDWALEVLKVGTLPTFANSSPYFARRSSTISPLLSVMSQPQREL